MTKTVAFIGAGNMGSRMARGVSGGGYDLIICDPSETVRADFAQAGAKVTASAADTAAADVVMVLVANDAQLEAAIFGPSGLSSGLDPAKPPIVLLMSTTLPKTAMSVRDRLRAHGAAMLDAPVSGGLAGAEHGTLSVMMGGDDALIDAVMPVVKCMGQKVFRCGPVGAAQAVKLVNNMIGITNIYLVSEAFALAENAGIDLAVLGPILEASTGRTYLSKDIAQTRYQYASWARSFEAFEALSRITRKDMHLVEELAAGQSLQLPLLKAVASLLDETPAAVFERWQTLGQLGK